MAMEEATTEGTARLRGAARALALEITAEARSEWGFATDLVAAAFRQNRRLGSHDRRLVAETVYGLIRHDRRLDAIADELLERRRERRDPLPPAARAELKLLIHELRQGLPVETAELRHLVHGASDADRAAAAGDEAGLGARTGLDRDAVRLSYPTWLLERLVAEAEDGLALAEAMNRRAPLTIRANTVKITREALAERLAG